MAFLSGRHPRHVVLVGGLTDGLLFAPYVRPLAARLEERRWSLVQTLLSSSHTGYGCASLDQDAEELHRLACHLRAEYGSQVRGESKGLDLEEAGNDRGGSTCAWAACGQLNAHAQPAFHLLLRMVAPRTHHSCAYRNYLQGMVIVGHSTGCQDAVRYAQRYRAAPSSGGGSQGGLDAQQQAGTAAAGTAEGTAAAPAAHAGPEAAPLLGVVLQAPVSDVECFGMQPSTAERIERAAAMVAAGQGEDIAFRATDIDGAPMTARRWLSLACPGGDDDMFSCSLSSTQLDGIYGPLRGLPALLLLSGADQYLAPDVDYPGVGRRLAQVGCTGGRHLGGWEAFCHAASRAGSWRALHVAWSIVLPSHLFEMGVPHALSLC